MLGRNILRENGSMVFLQPGLRLSEEEVFNIFLADSRALNRGREVRRVRVSPSRALILVGPRRPLWTVMPRVTPAVEDGFGRWVYT